MVQGINGSPGSFCFRAGMDWHAEEHVHVSTAGCYQKHRPNTDLLWSQVGSFYLYKRGVLDNMS